MNNHEKAVELGRNFANTMFKDMLNVNFQGQSFDWDNFPSMFSETCAATLFTTYRKNPKNIEELERVAKESFMKEGMRIKEEYKKTSELPVKS